MGFKKKYFFANLPTSRPYMDTNPINIIGSLYSKLSSINANNENMNLIMLCWPITSFLLVCQ